MQSNPATPSDAVPPRCKPVAVWVLLGVAVVAFAVFPPVRFHRYRPGGPAAAGGGTGGVAAVLPEAAAARFWDERLQPATKSAAADAGAVVAALRGDPAAARKQYGRTPALGGPTYFFVAGG